ncbi:glycosyltransferase [soil metagenome]
MSSFPARFNRTPSVKHFLLLPFGTSGSVFPFIWLGRKLREQGHRVTLITSPQYQKIALAAGLEFLAPEQDQLQEMLADPTMWVPGGGARVGFKHASRATKFYNEAVEKVMAECGKPDLLIAPMITFGARLAREKHGIPLITVHIYPSAMMSAAEVPLVYPSIRHLRRLPFWLRQACFKLPSPFDRFALPEVRQACLETGVSPPRRLWKTWHHSPDGVLALYPQWYGAPQRDWPHNTFQWDFPLEDIAAQQPLEPGLAAFLDAGEKPVLFTPGSGHLHARSFFQTAARLVKHTGCRAVFLTADLNQIPANLPDSIYATTYAPFSVLLPKARAMVHHGGIGTLSQCFKAGIPQLLVVMSIDQPDNAERVTKLGAGLGMNAMQFTFEKALPMLKRCLEDESLRHNAGKYAEFLRHQPPIEALVRWVESVSLLPRPIMPPLAS